MRKISRKKPQQTQSSLNNSTASPSSRKIRKSYKAKYGLERDLTNRYSSWVTNPTVQPDEKTEMGVPVPDKLNTEFSKEYQEENQL